MILTNANVLTMDDARPRAEAVAIRGDTIVAVGTAADVDPYRGPGTTVVDVGGTTLVPGFIDAHQYRIHKRSLVGISEPATVIQTAIEQGWTTLHEVYTEPTFLPELRELDRTGSLRVRVDAYLPWMQHDPQGTSARAHRPHRLQLRLRHRRADGLPERHLASGRPLLGQDDISPDTALDLRAGVELLPRWEPDSRATVELLPGAAPTGTYAAARR